MESVKSFYEELYIGDALWRLTLDGVEFSRSSKQYYVHQEQPFTGEEIHEILMSCKGNKAPRSDWFNMNFFQEN